MQMAIGEAANSTVPPSLPNTAKLERAKRRVAALKGFYVHLAVFTLVLAGLLVVDVATGPDWWMQWVALGWGIGVIAHALAVFGQGSRLIADWEARKLQQLMQQP